MNNIIIEEDVEYKNGDIDENKNDYFELEDDLDLEKIDVFNDDLKLNLIKIKNLN